MRREAVGYGANVEEEKDTVDLLGQVLEHGQVLVGRRLAPGAPRDSGEVDDGDVLQGGGVASDDLDLVRDALLREDKGPDALEDRRGAALKKKVI